MPKHVLMSAAFIFSLFCGNTFASSLLLANGEWPPYQSATLPQQGFVSAVVRQAAGLVDINVSYRFYPWKRAEEMVRTNHIDGSLDWSQTPERDRFALFSDPVITDQEIMVYQRKLNLDDWPLRQQWHDLKIALPLGSRTFPGLDELEQQGKIHYHSVESPESGLKMIAANRLHAMSIARNVYLGWCSQVQHLDICQRLAVLPTPIQTLAFRVMLSRRLPQAQQVITRLNLGLQQLRQNGQYAALEKELLPQRIAATTRTLAPVK